MIAALLLLASLSQAQEVSTDTLEIPLTTQVEISNLSKSVIELQGGRPIIPGIPRYINGICFKSNGTDCLTTAVSATAVDSFQIFTNTGCTVYYSTSATGSTPRQVTDRFCGAGGGGSQTGSAGGNGGASSFGTVVASSGIGGSTTAGVAGRGGFGGANTANGVFSSSSIFCVAGNGGGVNQDTLNYYAGQGGGSAFFGGGAPSHAGTVVNGAANTGGGGPSAFNNGGATGGGGGQCCEVTLWGASLPASVPICTGVGGTAGTNAGTGGSGVHHIREKF